MKPPFKFSWELVTPDLARKWLEKNGKNRALRRPTVNAFASDMARGVWSPTHQGIAFDGGGELIDGQHRLAGIVQSRVSIPFLICRDVPKRVTGVKSDVMDGIDRGNARSIGDVLKLAHGYKVNANLVAAICGMIARISLGKEAYKFGDSRGKKLTLPQTLAILDRWRAGLTFISENRTTSSGLRPAHICAAIALAHAVEARATEEFYSKFSSGVGIEAGSPVLTIRNFFLDNRAGEARGTTKERVERARLVLHALYCFIHSLPMFHIVRGTEKNHSHHFLDRQSENVAFIDQLFPKVRLGDEQVVTAATWKPTPEAESLLRGNEMSDRIKRKIGDI